MTHIQDIAADNNPSRKCSRCVRVITEGEGRYFLPGVKVLCCACMDNLQEIKKQVSKCAIDKFSTYDPQSNKID